MIFDLASFDFASLMMNLQTSNSEINSGLFGLEYNNINLEQTDLNSLYDKVLETIESQIEDKDFDDTNFDEMVQSFFGQIQQAINPPIEIKISDSCDKTETIPNETINTESPNTALPNLIQARENNIDSNQNIENNSQAIQDPVEAEKHSISQIQEIPQDSPKNKKTNPKIKNEKPTQEATTVDLDIKTKETIIEASPLQSKIEFKEKPKISNDASINISIESETSNKVQKTNTLYQEPNINPQIKVVHENSNPMPETYSREDLNPYYQEDSNNFKISNKVQKTNTLYQEPNINPQIKIVHENSNPIPETYSREDLNSYYQEDSNNIESKPEIKINFENPIIKKTTQEASIKLEDLIKPIINDLNEQNTNTKNIEIIIKLKPKLALALEDLETTLDKQSQELSKEIAQIDLKKPESIQSILDKSNQIENIRKSQDFIQAINYDKEETTLSKIEKNIVQNKIKDFISKIQAPNSESSPQEDLIKPNFNNNETASDFIVKSNANKDFGWDKPSLETTTKEEENKNPDFVQLLSSPIINNKDHYIHLPKEAIKVQELTPIIEQASQAEPLHQEIHLSLKPEALGKIELNLIKNGNQIEVNIEVSTHEALREVKHMVEDIEAALVHKDFEASVYVKVDESSLNTGFDQSGQSAYNEAKEEQKNRQELLPEWIKSKNLNNNFDQTLNSLV